MEMGNFGSSNIDSVQEQVKRHPVVVYSTTTCPYCVKAKRLLTEEGVRYFTIELNKSHNSSISQGLIHLTGQTTVPQVFICGKFIGGFQELNALKDMKELHNAVQNCIAMRLFSAKELPLTAEAKALKSMVNKDAVVIFSSSTCPHSASAKDILKEEGMPFRAVDLDNIPTKGKVISDALRQTTAINTIPQIFVCGKYVGGLSELRFIRDMGALKGLVEECSMLADQNSRSNRLN